MSEPLKITDVIAILQQRLEQFGDLEVRAVWEGITTELSGFYRGRLDSFEPYRLLIDTDDAIPSDRVRDRARYEHPDDR